MYEDICLQHRCIHSYMKIHDYIPHTYVNFQRHIHRQTPRESRGCRLECGQCRRHAARENRAKSIRANSCASSCRATHTHAQTHTHHTLSLYLYLAFSFSLSPSLSVSNSCSRVVSLSCARALSISLHLSLSLRLSLSLQPFFFVLPLLLLPPSAVPGRDAGRGILSFIKNCPQLCVCVRL